MELKSLIAPARSTASAIALASLTLAWTAGAAPVAVGNSSFELPSTTFVSPQIDLWNKTPQPDWFQPQNGVTWDQLSGVFANTAPGTPSHIVNIDGSQAAYIISLPQAGITQVVSGKYEAGLQYSVSVGVIAGGNITEGTSLLVGLFYVDDAGAPVTVAGKTVTYTAAGFPNSIEFQDFQAVSSVLNSGDAAVGRNIGVQIVGTGGDGAGYWDVDNVRVSASTVPEPGTWALFTLGVAGLVTVGRRSVARR